MKLRSLVSCLALTSVMSGAGVFSAQAQPRPATQAPIVGAYCPNQITDVQRLRPLMDLLARGEGDYDSVNRGRAGDTPQGIRGLTGKDYSDFTVQQVMEMQASWLYAVGRYQFIPSTLRFAVAMSDVDMKDKFTNEAQDKLMVALILYKRPAIGAYLRGDHDYVGWALDELAREWASVEYRSGRGFYDHIGGNRASITRKEAWEMLQNIRKAWIEHINRLS